MATQMTGTGRSSEFAETNENTPVNPTDIANKAYVDAVVGGGSPLTTKGDIYTFSSVNARLAVGADGLLLFADSTKPTGNGWTTGVDTFGGITTHLRYVYNDINLVGLHVERGGNGNASGVCLTSGGVKLWGAPTLDSTSTDLVLVFDIQAGFDVLRLTKARGNMILGYGIGAPANDKKFTISTNGNDPAQLTIGLYLDMQAVTLVDPIIIKNTVGGNHIKLVNNVNGYQRIGLDTGGNNPSIFIGPSSTVGILVNQSGTVTVNGLALVNGSTLSYRTGLTAYSPVVSGNQSGAGVSVTKSSDADRSFLRWNQGNANWQSGFRAGPYSFVLEYQLSATPADDSGWTSALIATTAGAVTIGTSLVTGTTLRAGTSLSAATFANIGTVTGASAAGDFSCGLTGAAQLLYVQSTHLLTITDTSARAEHSIDGLPATNGAMHAMFNWGNAVIDGLKIDKSGDAGRSYLALVQGNVRYRLGFEGSPYTLKLYYGLNATPSSPGTAYFQLTTGGDILLGVSGSKIGFLGAAAVVQQTVGAVTNSVTAGGTDGTIADFSDLTTYANSAATIRNDIYQLARSVAQLTTMARNLGLAA